MYLNNFDKSQEGSSSDDVHANGPVLGDSSTFLQNLTQNIGKPEYLTTTIFEENEEKGATSEEDEKLDQFERDNSENVENEFEFKFEDNEETEVGFIALMEIKRCCS